MADGQWKWANRYLAEDKLPILGRTVFLVSNLIGQQGQMDMGGGVINKMAGCYQLVWAWRAKIFVIRSRPLGRSCIAID